VILIPEGFSLSQLMNVSVINNKIPVFIALQDLLFLVCFTIIYWLGVDLQHQSFNTGKTEYLKGILVPVYFKWKTGNRKTN
jgi:hypothetical protein